MEVGEFLDSNVITETSKKLIIAKEIVEGIKVTDVDTLTYIIGCLSKGFKKQKLTRILLLKIVEFIILYHNQIDICGELIPDGVEILGFGYLSFLPESVYTPFSTLPTSIHTIKNAICTEFNILADGYNGGGSGGRMYVIPSNITSISFFHCTLPISYKEDHSYLKLPNSLKTLKFNGGKWDNGCIPIVKGDIPSSVTKLSLSAYAIYKLLPDTLPISINELSLQYTNDPNDINKPSFDFMVNMNIKKLEITYGTVYFMDIITPQSNLCKCNSLTSILLAFLNRKQFPILPNSFPSKNLTELTLSRLFVGSNFKQDIIPNTVRNLKLLFSVQATSFSTTPNNFRESIPNSVTSLTINKTFDEDVLPLSLTHLDLNGKHVGKNLKENIGIMVSNLTSINLPFYFKDQRLNLPNSIKNKNYINA